MGCGSCGGYSVPVRYVLETPDGDRRVFLSEIEARIAATTEGGGVITRWTSPTDPLATE